MWVVAYITTQWKRQSVEIKIQCKEGGVDMEGVRAVVWCGVVRVQGW